MEQFANLLQAISALAQALAWPFLVLFMAIFFGAPLKKFLDNVGEFTFKAGASGLEASAKRQQIEAAAYLGVASGQKLHEQAEPTSASANTAIDIADVVTQANSRRLQQLSDALVLWVDDQPSNNIYERRALEALGIRIVLSESTEDALKKLQERKFSAVISDMGRPSDRQAGYTLLAAKQDAGDQAPFIIYAGSNRAEYQAEARQKGAIGSTNNPQELFQMVLAAIGDTR